MLIIPVIITVLIYVVLLYYKDLRTIQEFGAFYLKKNSLIFLLKFISFGVYYIIIIKYKEPYEIITESQMDNQLIYFDQ